MISTEVLHRMDNSNKSTNWTQQFLKFII